MKFNIKMPIKLIPFYLKELEAVKDNLQQDNLQNAWHHLERAHIIAQKYPCEHTFVHWKMLQFGIKIKSFKEKVQVKSGDVLRVGKKQFYKLIFQ